MDMPYYFDEFETEDIQDWVRWAGNEIPQAKLRGDLDDVKAWESIVRSGAKELLRRYKDDE
tara:strand:+ start:26 stop:208 length:183 start_codon:yes stop_codon:yes gene_type:complete